MTFYKISCQDGGTIDLTLNLGALMELAKKHHELWERYNALYKKVGSNQDFTELDMGELFYIAYVAAHVNDELMDLTEFLYKVTDSREEMAEVFKQMFGSKKKQTFQPPSKKRHGK